MSSLMLTCVALAGGCAPEPLAFEEGCSPLLADVDCGLPFPSDFFLVDDPTTPTGRRVKLAGPARLVTSSGGSADVNDFWAPDGFSRLPPIVVSFGVPVDDASVPGIFDDPAATLARGFHTALIDADSGQRVAHFIDVDPRATDEAREALVIHPIDPLRPRTRYVVALSGVRARGGGAVAPSEAFRRMRDARVGDDPTLGPLLQRYEREIFPVLARDGLARGALQLAWDFTTGSTERPLEDMLAAREAALAALAAAPPTVEVEAVFEGEALAALLDDAPGNTWRVVKGFIVGPRVVDSDDAGALLTRGADGAVRVGAVTRFPFTAVLPASVRDSVEPAPVMLFGHGFFGDRGELTARVTRAIVDHAGVVAIAIDWQGMSVDDIGLVVSTMGGDVARGLAFGERVIQAMVNWLTVVRALELGELARDAAFRRTVALARHPGSPAREVSVSVIDPQRPLGFLGISMGHILGGTLSALSPAIERSVFMVGGAGFSTMMFRARPFERFLFLLDLSLPDPLDQRKLSAQMQAQFDRFDPVAFSPYVLADDLPSGPPNGHARRRVLELYGVADTQVPNLGSQVHARLLGLPQVGPSPVPPLHGLKQQAGPIEGSALAVYDFGFDDAFYAEATPAPESNGVHEGLRTVPAVLEQVRVFLREGRVENTCDGPCALDASAFASPP